MSIFKKYVYTMHEKDAAPMLPLIDVTRSYGVDSCCVPVPMRIDKLINGDLTTLIMPRGEITKNVGAKIYCLNINNFTVEVVNLLIDWGKQLVKEKFNKILPADRLYSWWEKTSSTQINSPTLSSDLTDFLNYYFDKVLWPYLDGSSLEVALQSYIDYVIDKCCSRISDNSVWVYEKEVRVEYPMLEHELLEKDYLNHDIKGNTIPVDVVTASKRRTLKFRPFLIYQDLLETMKFSKENLHNLQLLSPQVLLEKKIISVHDRGDTSLEDSSLNISLVKDKIKF